VGRLVTTLNKADRDALIRVVKDRAKLAEKDVAARARVLLAEVLDLMAAEFAANDALWSDQLLLAEEGVRLLNAQIRQRCSEVGTPARFAPDVTVHWHSRSSEFSERERRNELKALAEARIAALVDTAKVEVQRQSSDLAEKLIIDGLDSEAARRFVEALPTIEQLMPPLSLDELGVKRWQPDEDAAARLATPSTPADRKRRRILQAIERTPGASNQAIAQIAGCDPKTVAKLRGGTDKDEEDDTDL
jgi:hypothetical protein